MRPMSEVKNHTMYVTTMKNKLYATFGENDFSDAMFNVIGSIIDDYVAFDYNTWLYSDEEIITNNNISRYTSFVHRWIMRKYKYFEFFKDRWSIETGTNYGNTETKTRTLTRDRETTTNNSTTDTNSHTSHTDTTYTSSSNETETGENTSNSMSENAPLGATSTINTPYGKDNVEGSVSRETDLTREDGQNIGVESSDNGQHTFVGTGTEDYTDTETETITFDNGVEILKAMKYNDMSVMDILQDILDRTVYEFNEVL